MRAILHRVAVVSEPLGITIGVVTLVALGLQLWSSCSHPPAPRAVSCTVVQRDAAGRLYRAGPCSEAQ